MLPPLVFLIVRPGYGRGDTDTAAAPNNRFPPFYSTFRLPFMPASK